MIDSTPEQPVLIPLRDVAKLKWLRVNKGKCPHIATLWRWTTRGIRGARLKTVCVGAIRCTSEQWLREFFEAATPNINAPPAPMPPTPHQRRRAIERAERALDAAGI